VNNVNAGDTLGDRMLNLQPSVHFQEVKLTLAVHQKLHRAYINYTDNMHTIHTLISVTANLPSKPRLSHLQLHHPTMSFSGRGDGNEGKLLERNTLHTG